MREIKFRDYDLEKKQMRYFDLDQYDRNQHDRYCNTMQFTGMIDKEGKEIYENDVLKYNTHKDYQLPTFKAKIVWIEGYACFGYQRLLNGDWCPQVPFNEHDELQHDFLNHIEIIGNIIDNPELL